MFNSINFAVAALAVVFLGAHSFLDGLRRHALQRNNGKPGSLFARLCFLMLHGLTLPGIVLHEAAHYLVGKLLLARPTHFSLYPSFKDSRHGFVSFVGLNPANVGPVALAPILLWPIAYWVLTLPAPNWQSLLLNAYFCSAIAYGAWPSSTDLRVMRSVMWRWLKYVVLVGVCSGIYFVLMP